MIATLNTTARTVGLYPIMIQAIVLINNCNGGLGGLVILVNKRRTWRLNIHFVSPNIHNCDVASFPREREH